MSKKYRPRLSYSEKLVIDVLKDRTIRCRLIDAIESSNVTEHNSVGLFLAFLKQLEEEKSEEVL